MWNGSAWEPLTDWYTAYQEIVWEQIEEDAHAFRQAN
jgi:branched-chain amino acid transport system substrate-binding protein